MKHRTRENRFEIRPRGPFSLAASTQFLEGFTPTAFEGDNEGHLHFAFSREGTWSTVAVCVRQIDRLVIGTFVGDANAAAIRHQVVRILSLDVDGSGFPQIGRRDRVVGALQKRFPGLRPVLFWSPYEAAAWAIIGQRIRMAQAARIKQRIAEESGQTVEIHGRRLHAFPSPEKLSRMQRFPGLTISKVDRLRELGAAALDGQLDPERLRAMRDPLEHLKQLPGIGDFSAELILVRGAGEPDYWPRNEQRLHRAMTSAYGFKVVPSVDELAEIAQKWRPYRSWVSLLFRAASGPQAQ
jgi:DNA-3-methyladenine glycosylase II